MFDDSKSYKSYKTKEREIDLLLEKITIEQLDNFLNNEEREYLNILNPKNLLKAESKEEFLKSFKELNIIFEEYFDEPYLFHADPIIYENETVHFFFKSIFINTRLINKFEDWKINYKFLNETKKTYPQGDSTSCLALSMALLNGFKEDKKNGMGIKDIIDQDGKIKLNAKTGEAILKYSQSDKFLNEVYGNKWKNVVFQEKSSLRPIKADDYRNAPIYENNLILKINESDRKTTITRKYTKLKEFRNKLYNAIVNSEKLEHNSSIKTLPDEKEEFYNIRELESKDSKSKTKNISELKDTEYKEPLLKKTSSEKNLENRITRLRTSFSL